MDQFRLAIGEAVLGVIGDYSYCSFVSEGKGYFKPDIGAVPSIGVSKIRLLGENSTALRKTAEQTNMIEIEDVIATELGF